MAGDVLIIPRRVWRVLRGIPDTIQVIGAVVAVIIFLIAATAAMKASLQMPAKLEAHMRQADTLIYELREGRRQAHEDALRQLCITVTPRADWAKDCFTSRVP